MADAEIPGQGPSANGDMDAHNLGEATMEETCGKEKEDENENENENENVESEEGLDKEKAGPEEDLEKDDAEEEDLEKDDGNNSDEMQEEDALPEDTKEEDEEEQEEDAKEEEEEEKGKLIDTETPNPVEPSSNTKTPRKRKRAAASPATPSSLPSTDRPLRERKTVERFATASMSSPAPKEFTIEKGKGTMLKDIPNVVYKLSKKSRADETVKFLHSLLYGKRGKAFFMKSNILQFSGYVWGENEEKMKTKLKERLDKCNKENLFNACDLLDIRSVKQSSKKEDLVANLLDFLESPHITTDFKIQEQTQKDKSKKKRKRGKRTSGKKTDKSSEKSSRKKRKVVSSKKVKQNETDEDMADASEKDEDSHGTADDMPESDREEEHIEEKNDEDYGTRKNAKGSSKKVSAKKKTDGGSPHKNKQLAKVVEASPNKAQKSPKGTATKKLTEQADPEVPSGSKVFSRKNKKAAPESEKAPSENKKQGRKKLISLTDKTVSKQKGGKTKDKSGTEAPTDDDVQAEICEILKEVDFNTATFTDILRRLEEHFSYNFSERKQQVKKMIQTELSKLAERDDEEQSMGGDESNERDVSEEMTGQVVEAE